VQNAVIRVVLFGEADIAENAIGRIDQTHCYDGNGERRSRYRIEILRQQHTFQSSPKWKSTIHWRNL